MRRRFSLWLAVTVLAAGCAASASKGPAASDATDVWFMQHLAGHLQQTSAILDLNHDRITRPKLARLVGVMKQQHKASLEQVQEWLARRGLAGYDPQQQSRRGQQSDLDRLSRIRGAKFELALIKVLMARHRAGSRLAATEISKGTVPEVRQLAQQLLIQQRGQTATMAAWARAWPATAPSAAPSAAQSAAGRQ